MIEVSRHITLDESELHFEFVRSSGPGGQNVNKVATAVQLRFDVAATRALSLEVKERLRKITGRRMTDAGVLIIDARRYRSQERNRQDAVDRLVHWIRRAEEVPKPRKATKPSRGAKERRHKVKQRRSDVKKTRRKVRGED